MNAAKRPTAPDTQLRLRRMFKDYHTAMAAIVTRDADGRESVGSGFHVGDGIFVTARHVVDQAVQVELRCVVDRVGIVPGEAARIIGGPVVHPDADVDVAAIKIELVGTLPIVPLGGHLDDWIRDRDFVLNEVLVMAFPPIPLAREPVMIAARGEVNAIIDPVLGARHPHFILSMMARGGYSGGLVLSEWGFALGIITMSLVKDHAPEELGYLTALTVEPIFNCLAHHKWLPEIQSEPFGTLWNSTTEHYGDPERRIARAWIEDFNDGRKLLLRFASPSLEITQAAMAAAKENMAAVTHTDEIVPREVGQITCRSVELEFEAAIARARAAIVKVFSERGYLPVVAPIVMTRREPTEEDVKLLKYLSSDARGASLLIAKLPLTATEQGESR